MDPRFDYRKEKQFKKEIKIGHKEEILIAVRLCIAEHALSGIWPILEPTGVDFTGNFIKNFKEVVAKPDYKIGETYVEITRSAQPCRNYFHEKCYKMKRCLDEGNSLIFVNGFQKFSQPDYVWIYPPDLELFLQKAISKYGQVKTPGKDGWTNKPAYRFDLYWFKDWWRKLPVLCPNLPQKYLELIEKTK